MGNLISVILPAYNVGKYIAECIQSLQKQTYKDIEIIVVDDGSTDNTAEVVKSFCDDDRVSYHYQTNAGSGPARNHGLELAKGEWIMFVDPDDWVDKDIVDALHNKAVKSGADLVCSGYTDVMLEDGMEKRRIDRIPQRRELRTQKECRDVYMDLLISDVLSPPTRKLYKTEIIRENDVQFPDLRRSQDIVFNYRYFDHVRSCVVIDKSLYFYRVVGTTEYIAKLKPDYYETVKVIYRDLEELHINWGYREQSPQTQKIYDYCENLIMLNIEANVIRGDSIDDILGDEDIKMIVKQSQSAKVFNRMMKKCYQSRNEKLLKLTVHLRSRLRRIKRSIE